jgi:hypothetical protein
MPEASQQTRYAKDPSPPALIVIPRIWLHRRTEAPRDMGPWRSRGRRQYGHLPALPKAGVAPSFRPVRHPILEPVKDAVVAQLVRAPVCGTGGRWFEPTQLYQGTQTACHSSILLTDLTYLPARMVGLVRAKSGEFVARAGIPKDVREQ